MTDNTETAGIVQIKHFESRCPVAEFYYMFFWFVGFWWCFLVLLVFWVFLVHSLGYLHRWEKFVQYNLKNVNMLRANTNLWRPIKGNHYILSLHFIHVLFTIQTWRGRGDEALLRNYSAPSGILR